MFWRYRAQQFAKAKEKAIEEKQRENARTHEIEEIRKVNAQGLERKRADGGVSFLYDAPQIVEKYQEERDKVSILPIRINSILL